MRRKVLQDHANVLCQMALDYHLAYQEDLEEMADVGRGQLLADVLTAEGWIDGRLVRRLRYPHIVAEWFDSQLSARKIPRVAVVRARVAVDFSVAVKDSGDPLVMSAHCEFDCSSAIDTDEKSYRGHSRGSQTYGFVRDPVKQLIDYYWPRDAPGDFRPAWLKCR